MIWGNIICIYNISQLHEHIYNIHNMSIEFKNQFERRRRILPIQVYNLEFSHEYQVGLHYIRTYYNIIYIIYVVYNF